MTITASIATALKSLASQVTAAKPIAGASQATRTALKLNAASLVASIQSALTATSILDTYVAPTDPDLIVAGIAQLSTAADDQSALSLMRGVTGRVASNLDQLP